MYTYPCNILDNTCEFKRNNNCSNAQKKKKRNYDNHYNNIIIHDACFFMGTRLQQQKNQSKCPTRRRYYYYLYYATNTTIDHDLPISCTRPFLAWILTRLTSDLNTYFCISQKKNRISASSYYNIFFIFSFVRYTVIVRFSDRTFGVQNRCLPLDGGSTITDSCRPDLLDLRVMIIIFYII